MDAGDSKLNACCKLATRLFLQYSRCKYSVEWYVELHSFPIEFVLEHLF